MDGAYESPLPARLRRYMCDPVDLRAVITAETVYVDATGATIAYADWLRLRAANPPEAFPGRWGATLWVVYVGIWWRDGSRPLPWHVERSVSHGGHLVSQHATRSEAVTSADLSARRGRMRAPHDHPGGCGCAALLRVPTGVTPGA